MVLYARSDVMSATVPVESGGCGHTHSRPVLNGKPDKVFKIECQGCENYLRQDIVRTGMKKVRTGGDRELKDRYLGLWGWNDQTIPETFDQEREREHAEQESAVSAANANKDALSTIAAAMAGNQELLAQLARMMAPQGAEPLPQTAINPPEPEPEPDSSYVQRQCKDCPAMIVRTDGQKGMLPHRCPDCKARHEAGYRKR
jgi:hypothetical protein